jgi:phosphoribosylformylglycinamidine synthase
MIHRIDVRTLPTAREGEPADPLGQALRHQIAEFGKNVGPIGTSRIFLIDSDASREQVKRIAGELLADPIVEAADLFERAPSDAGKSRIEIHLKPGVMDPVAASTEMAIRDMKLPVREVRTGRAFIIEGKLPQSELEDIASKVLANGVIESVHFGAFVPKEFARGREEKFELRHVKLRELSDDQLKKLSREGHLFLSLAEMKAIQNYFREQDREATDVELETLAQTWSEHCVHKTLKSAVEVVDESGKPLRKYGNLIKDTIFASTQTLMKQKEGFCLSVFKDNAGVISFDDTDAVCFKVETHNHPSAIEPYGGSATGVGGVIRDILGTGLAAKPIANTDVFCVAYPNRDSAFGIRRSVEEQNPNAERRTPNAALPKGVIHPKRILQQVVAGVRDYGNRMGIPTINGAVYFDDNYLGNPLVFCGCVGLIPRNKIEKAAKEGDAIVLMGGRTGRDGIHGATFSSAELTDTHADEFSHAVQIGNAITQKKMADVILQARDRDLFNAITDLGAGGLSSGVGEMGEKTGAFVELDKVPLKYAGLKYDEIWISEAQERMLLAVPGKNVAEVLDLARREDVEATVIGHFGATDLEEKNPTRMLLLNYRGTEVGRMSMEFLHEGLPMPTRKAVVSTRGEGVSPSRSPLERQKPQTRGQDALATVKTKLLELLAHPNIASKHWIIRQYDHEVQGGSVIKPLLGPKQIGPSDASVIRPKLGSYKGVAIGCGLAPQIDDPYEMALAAIDEAIRNLVAVGADPNQTAILDNFCWPSVDDERTMGTLVRACEACRDAALAYGIPFISGKDSLHNQFTNQETGEVLRIPSTLLISAIAVVDDVRKCVTMDLKKAGNHVVLIRPRNPNDLKALATTHVAMAKLISESHVAACHDVSEGGWVTAAAEMCIASGLGLKLEFSEQTLEWMFDESPGQYVIELNTSLTAAQLHVRFAEVGFPGILGQVTEAPKLVLETEEIAVADLTAAWRGTLDW